MKQILEFTFEPETEQSLAFKELDHERELTVRLDKWLWAARFFKTRALARNAVEYGKVLYNNKRVKAGIEIQLGATVNINQGHFSKFIKIIGLSTRRKNSEGALELFEELTPQTTSITPTRQNNRNSVSAYTEQTAKRVVRFLRRAFCRQF